MDQNPWGISPLGVGFLKKQEGYTPTAKWDYRQFSSGYGTRGRPGEVVDRAEAERRLLGETSKVSDWLGQNVTAPLDPGKKDALISFGYNLGTDDLDRLKGDINAQNWDRVGNRMLSFNKAGGQVNKGLVNRRQAEAEMLLGRKPTTLSDVMAAGMAGSGGMAPQAQPVPGPVPPEALTPPSGRYSKLADALLASAAGAKPKGWGELLNAGGDLALGYSLAGKEDKAQKDYSSKLSQMLSGANTPEAMTQAVLASGDDKLMQAGVAAKLKPPAKPDSGRYKFDKNVGIVDGATGQVMKSLQELGIKPTEPAARVPMGYRIGQDGNLSFIPGGPADPAVKPKGRDKYTEGQTKAANFGNMMTEADKTLLGMSPKGPDGKPVPMENPKGFLGAVRDGVWMPEAARNSMTPNDTQAYNQVAKQWIRAKLRKESGAAIGADEMEQEFRTYFPQYGDGPEVLKQKADAREQATKGMIAESGGAFGQLFPATDAPVTETPGGPPPAAAGPQAAPAPSGPPAPAIEFLRSNPTPEMMALFESKYKLPPGAAQQILGQAQQQPAPPQQQSYDPSTGAPAY